MNLTMSTCLMYYRIIPMSALFVEGSLYSKKIYPMENSAQSDRRLSTE